MNKVFCALQKCFDRFRPLSETASVAKVHHRASNAILLGELHDEVSLLSSYLTCWCRRTGNSFVNPVSSRSGASTIEDADARTAWVHLPCLRVRARRASQALLPYPRPDLFMNGGAHLRNKRSVGSQTVELKESSTLFMWLSIVVIRV